ncbi:hypothetical protein SAMN05444008_102391 [Cnuella takakiae]|uniref:Regulatory protein, luxR family n=1 Tax=Cnuella takakiae TaxID=1302690 RepID=A0A1M4VUY7_9BACT|nr:sigma-70 family RNA polymerase sigma factor [Cnuella takakiae]OLY92491.1 hypothetical protein BUE76_11780 [Cnuella takakiae]SHE72730.1 hypothetical protein SAMN05444008_102391 [Cnuella takakiae]
MTFTSFERLLISFAIAGFTIKEIAHEVGKNEDAIESTLRRARTRIGAKTLTQLCCMYLTGSGIPSNATTPSQAC